MVTPLRIASGVAKVKTVAFGDGPLGMGLADAPRFRADASSPGSDEQYLLRGRIISVICVGVATLICMGAATVICMGGWQRWS